MAGMDKARWQRVSPLLDELLDSDDAQRQTRMAQLRLRDAALADEVAALLAQQAAIETADFLAGSALAPPDGTVLAGRRIGAWTLERMIGAGGMGTVWRARRSDGRYEGLAAVKFLNLALLGHGGAERFRREGSALARLTHPDIARLIDAGIDEGQPFLVLEYIEGETIDRWCDARALAVEARVRLLVDVLATVAHAHGRLILHRDLKPSNILVTAEGRVKLLDFGIAKLIDDPEVPGPPTALTQASGRAFTPEYAAPEQVQGGEVTMATDVYALGVLLYVLLTGTHPTAAANASPVDRMRALLETEPAPASSAAARVGAEVAQRRSATPRHLARALRGDLDNIVAKALKKSPTERYATVTALADDLRRALVHEPVSARPDTWRYRAGTFVRRHRLGVGAGALVALSLVAGAAATAWQAREARRERDAALFQAERALAKGNLFNLLLGALGNADRPLTQREILERGVQLVEKQFAQQPRLAVDLLLPIAGQFMTLGDLEREAAVMQRIVELAQAAGEPNVIASAACNSVETEINRGRIDRAREHLRRAEPLLQQGLVTIASTRIVCLQAQGDVARADGDLTRATERIAEAIALSEQSGQTRGNTYPKLLSILALLLDLRGDLPGSLAAVQKLQRLHEDEGRAGTLDQLLARRIEAMILIAWGEYREADERVASLLPHWREAGAELPGWLAYSRGLLALSLGDPAGAEQVLAAAAAKARSHGNQRDAVASDFARAQALIDLGRLDEAEALVASIPAVTDVRVYRRITPAAVRARLLLARGYPGAAMATLEPELMQLKERPVAGTPNALAAALRVAVEAKLALGDTTAALALATEAVAAAQRSARDPARSADVGQALLLLALAQRAAGHAGAAAVAAERAAGPLLAGFGPQHASVHAARSIADR